MTAGLVRTQDGRVDRTTGTRPSLAGRVPERRRLLEILATPGEHPRFVLVRGEPGVGKTRLLREVTDDAAVRGARVLWGSCLRFATTSAPYLPLITALESWLSDHDGRDDPDQRDDLTRRVLAQAPVLTPLIPHLTIASSYRSHRPPPPLGGPPVWGPAWTPTWTPDRTAATDLPPTDVPARTEPEPGRVLAAWDTALSVLCADAPTVLVVDDLHWADLSSLDVLTYLASAPGRRRLTILATFRDAELPDGHPLHGWLADLRRLPTVHELALAPFTLEETQQQVALLLGHDPRPELVAGVHARSRGNAYLTELLTQGVDSDADALPAGLPEALRTALLANWHRLPPAARDTVVLLSIAGRPTTARQLARVAARVNDVDQLANHGRPDRTGRRRHAEVRADLREAATLGIVTTDRSGSIWFRHPLLAEVVEGVVSPEGRRTLHAAFADTYENDEYAGSADPDGEELAPDALTLADRAVHCEHAGRYDDAFEYTQRAADQFARLQAYREEAALRCRAVALWTRTSRHVRARYGSETSLLTTAARVARWAGDEPAALRMLERARQLVDPVHEPLTAARVLTLWAEAAFTSGLVDGAPMEEFARVVDLTTAHPDSPEHAHALADLAESEAWHGQTRRAREHADRAVAAAHRSGEPAQVSYALKARTLAYFGEDSVLRDATESVRFAEKAGQPEYVALACLAQANALDSRGRIAEEATVLLEGHAAAQQVGFGGLTLYLAGGAAHNLLLCGDLPRADRLLREMLATRPAGIAGAQAHTLAVVAAVRQGQLSRAEGHLEAARVLVPRLEHQPGLHASSAVAEYLLATGRPRETMLMLTDTLEPHARAEPQYVDSLLAWGARAAADWAVLPSSKGGGGRTAALQALERLTAIRAQYGEPFALEHLDPVDRAWRAWYDAESARLQDAADTPDQWAAAARHAAAADLKHTAGEALLRLAESLGRAGRPRTRVANPLRRANRLATQLGAVALQRRVAGFARLARIELTDPATGPIGGQGSGDAQTAVAAQLLTPRELEVVRHLAVGRSYAEIAEALFISQKTVGVHVSNVLRKTGTSNRVDAAVWARDHGLAEDPPANLGGRAP